MRLTKTLPALLLAASTVAVAILPLAGCASTSRAAPTVEWLKADLGSSARECVQFAGFVRDFVERSQVAAADKPMLLARAAVLEHHANVLLDHLARPESTRLSGSDTESADLTARIAAIRRERAGLEFEWNIWQVAHGVKRADDTELYLILPGAGC